MNKLIYSVLVLAVIFFLNTSSVSYPVNIIDGETAVSEILEQLGDTPLPHKSKMELAGVSVENGKSIVHTGYSRSASGKKSKVQSRHFKCTACHNVAREDPDLSVSDPEARLTYAQKNNLPFLQGTTALGF